MDFTRIFDIIDYQSQKFPQQVALAMWQGQGQWKTFSTDEIVEKVEQMSTGLLQLGLERGEKIALIGKTGSPQWNILDLAAQQIGLIVVPILAGAIPYQMEYILAEAEIKYIFFNQNTDYQGYEYFEKNGFVVFILENDFEKLLKIPTETEKKQIQNIKKSIKAEDLATIIYTSGTTGEPKGVMLSHQNVVSNVKSVLPLVPFMYGKVTLSFLPLSHIFERTIVFTSMAIGANIHYSGGIDNLQDCLQSAQPHYLSAVPRVLEKMHDKIMEQREKGNFLTRKALDFAIKLGEDWEGKHKEDVFGQTQRVIADWLVYRIWRKKMGGRIKGIIVGAAALQPRLSKLFSAAKIPIREGYGCTETSPVVAFNRFEPGGSLFGTVGMAVPGVEIKIEDSPEYPDSNGEILVKGSNVMMGYYKKGDATKEVFTEDGWYRTGDIGHFTHKWFLKITDRKRDFFKTSTGRYIAPQVIENQLKTSVFIDQCMTFGLGKPYVVALIVPNFHKLKDWCETNKVHWTAPQFMVINPKVEKFFKQLVSELNAELQPQERIQNFHLCYEEWNIASNELTPTLKIRRKVITDKYKNELEKMYQP